MKKNYYIAPVTEVCMPDLTSKVMDTLNFKSAEKVDEGIINSNDGDLWDEDEASSDQSQGHLWDTL